MWILAFAIGASIGSFLNVCIDRLPQGQSILRPPSRCPGCGRSLVALDLIPIISYLFLRGRCRYCGLPIPRRILVVELGVACLFVVLYMNYGQTVQLLMVAAYLCVFLLLAVIDLEQGLIPNNIVYPAVAASVVASPFRPVIGLSGLLPYQGTLQGTLLVFLGGGVVLFVVFLVIALVSRGGMGGGDIKMAGLVGLAVGLLNAPAALLVCWVGGGIAAIALVLIGVRRRREAIPFGPFIAFGGAVALIWGESLTRWYLRLMGAG